MKRTALFLMVLLSIAGLAAAQSNGGKAPDPQQPKQLPAQPVAKIEGKLALINGEIGIAYNNKTYYLAMPQYLFGFIDGLKEGSAVKLEGYEFANPRAPDYVQFRVTKLTFNGRDFDLSSAGRGAGAMMGGKGIDGRGPGRMQGQRR